MTQASFTSPPCSRSQSPPPNGRVQGAKLSLIRYKSIFCPLINELLVLFLSWAQPGLLPIFSWIKPGGCYLKLSHFSDPSVGDKHGYNANGPKSPSKLPNSRFQAVACSCFRFSLLWILLSSNETHASDIKEDRKWPECPETPGVKDRLRQASLSCCPWQVCDSIFLWTSCYLLANSEPFQLASALMNAKQPLWLRYRCSEETATDLNRAF